MACISALLFNLVILVMLLMASQTSASRYPFSIFSRRSVLDVHTNALIPPPSGPSPGSNGVLPKPVQSSLSPPSSISNVLMEALTTPSDTIHGVNSARSQLAPFSLSSHPSVSSVSKKALLVHSGASHEMSNYNNPPQPAPLSASPPSVASPLTKGASVPPLGPGHHGVTNAPAYRRGWSYRVMSAEYQSVPSPGVGHRL